MKSIIMVIFLLFYFSGFSQEVKNQQNPTQNQKIQSSGRKYSSYNLQQASMADLNLLLQKAKRKKTVGIIMSLTGPALIAVGVSTAGEMDIAAAGIAVTGVITTLVGLPILAVGLSKTNKTKKAIRSHELPSLSIAPGVLHTNNDKNFYPVATLRIRF